MGKCRQVLETVNHQTVGIFQADAVFVLNRLLISHNLDSLDLPKSRLSDISIKRSGHNKNNHMDANSGNYTNPNTYVQTLIHQNLRKTKFPPFLFMSSLMIFNKCFEKHRERKRLPEDVSYPEAFGREIDIEKKKIHTRKRVGSRNRSAAIFVPIVLEEKRRGWCRMKTPKEWGGTFEISIKKAVEGVFTTPPWVVRKGQRNGIREKGRGILGILRNRGKLVRCSSGDLWS